jgi:small subunit ribosomal protein S20
MANHKSAEKRAKQALVREARNNSVKSKVKSAERKVRDAVEAKNVKSAQEALRLAFSTIQKSKGTLHPNSIKRKMARLATAVGALAKAS